MSMTLKDLELERLAAGIKLAETISHLVHMSQSDNQGVPYIEHPKAVAGMVSDAAKPVAWLHDVIEDAGSVEKEIVVGKILRESFSPETYKSILLLTRLSTENYEGYIRRIVQSGDKIAMEVKLADLTHNMRPGGNPEHQLQRYVPAIRKLREAGIDVKAA